MCHLYTVEEEWSSMLKEGIGCLEPAWSCLGRDGLITNITYNDTDKCNEMKKCKELNPINGSEFTSIVSTFKLVCDDAYKTDIIQIVQAVSLVCFMPPLSYPPTTIIFSLSDRSSEATSPTGLDVNLVSSSVNWGLVIFCCIVY